MKIRLKKTSLFMLIAMFVFLVGMIFTATIVCADTYYTLRVNYYYIDGTPARDAYVAVYPEGEDVDLTVTNPNIDGFAPKTAAEGGDSALTTVFRYDNLDSNHTENVYYVAGETHYRALYYKQNLYDDLYTRDNSLPSSLTDRFGKTGSNPTDLEDVQFEGFTNLFHEPDAIAADGSTVFRVYYDRNYYAVKFDLGEKGYGLDPIYAKYQSAYHITEPKRLGFTFKGWLRTDKDSTKGEYAHNASNTDEESVKKQWKFVDENGDELVDGSGNPIFDENGVPLNSSVNGDDYYLNFTEDTIPAYDSYYKAIWEKGTTSYSVVYWIQNPDGEDLTEEVINNTADIDEARALIAGNYTVVGTRIIENIESGSMINLETETTNAHGNPMKLREFFKYDLTGNGYFNLSEALIDELNGKEKYYEYNSYLSGLQFNGPHEEENKTHIEVMGDGTTRLNVYYNRKSFNLKFYYARQKLNNGVANGAIDLTNSTKNFSNYAYYTKTNETYLNALTRGTWQSDIADTLPQIREDLLVENGGPLTAGYNDVSGYRYYYYQISAKYNEPLTNKWRIDAISSVHKKGYADTEICYPGSWAVENGTYFYDSHTSVNNFTVKGVYERLGDELMFKPNTVSNYQELHYLLSWTNSATSSGWNYGISNVLHFTYNNYVELLPREIDIMTDDADGDGELDGVQALIDARLYEDVYELRGGTYTHIDPSQTFVYHSDAVYYGIKLDTVKLTQKELQMIREDKDEDGDPDGVQELIDLGYYKDVYEFSGGEYTRIDPTQTFVYNENSVYYGLKSDFIIETIDSGSQYPINNEASKTSAVRSDQVPTELKGYKLINADKKNSKGQIILDSSNTIVDWSDDTSSYRHATVKFFYNRRVYKLKWINGNVRQDDHERDVKYGAPLNSAYTHDEGDHHAGEYRYWFESPTFFNEDLRDYYNFIGWYYTPYYYRQVDKDTATMPADDVTLYARWDPKIINVSFYPTYNDYYKGTDKINGDIPVHYGDFISMSDIPANVEEDPENLRPDLNPPTTGAMFAGWYYLRDDIPVRFDPENIPITALNHESGLKDGARLRLYAEWATKDAAKYQVTYVEKDHPENEVASPTTGRAFVWKTKTFNAKGGSDLNEDHAWTENGINWWPTVKSSSMVIRANSQGHSHEYEPNVMQFEYIQKKGVYYRVQYLDAASRTPLLDPEDLKKDEVYSTHGSIKEDAPFIAGYTAEKMSQSIVLSASTKTNEDEQKAEELEHNVITFYYNKNEKNFVYEVEYYKQNADDDNYTHYLTENLEVENADNPDTEDVEKTYVSLSELYNNNIPKLIESEGFTRAAGETKVDVTTSDGVTTTSVADDASVEITGTEKSTIKIYYNRNTYDYVYQYIDYHAEQEYNKLSENERAGAWNGILETFDNNTPQKVESTVTIPAPRDTTYTIDGESVPYTRISTSDVTLTLAPTNPDNPDVNLVKVYYKKYYDRELSYKLVCKNEDDPYTEVDYDDQTHDPLFGGLSMTMQTVSDYNNISNVKFYDFNNAKGSDGADLHSHRYTFLGWYDNPEGTGEPLVPYDSENPDSWKTLTKANLGLEEGALPERDTTYYAVVEQDMVRANFEFRIVEEELPKGGEPIDETTGETEKDLEAAEIVRTATTDPDGRYTGRRFAFSDPYQYENGSPLPYHKSEGYTVDIVPLANDNRVYKYEFSEWWEEDLDNIDASGNTKLIRKKGWNHTDGSWAIDSLDKQLDRHEDKHVIAVFKRREITEMPYTIKYKYNTRQYGTQEFVVKGTLTEDELNEEHGDVKITNSNTYELTDEFIMSKAPYESNHGETLCWSDDRIEKTSVRGNPASEIASEQEDRIITTVTAVQNTKTVYAKYRLSDSGAYTTIATTVGANRETDEQLNALDLTKNENFSYWAVRKSENGKVITKCYKPRFSLCIMDDYYISPVFDENTENTKSVTLNADKLENGEEDWLAWTWNNENDGVLIVPKSQSDLTFTGLKNYVIFARVPIGDTSFTNEWGNVYNQTGDLEVSDNGTFTLTNYGGENNKTMFGTWEDFDITLTHLDYSRNRWTDADGNLSPSGATDMLYTDFEIAFNRREAEVYKDTNYRVGVVMEYCAVLPNGQTFVQGKDYNVVSDENNLKDAIKTNSSVYYYKTGKRRSISINDIPNANLTNRNRVEFAKPYANNYTESNGEKTYKNKKYLFKASAYIYDKSKDEVTLSNSVYVCMDNIGSMDDALPEMIVTKTD